MDRVGPYRIVESLGRGGMGHVWRGVHDWGHEAAVKVLDPQLATQPKVRARFLHGAQTMTQLAHANVVQVYDTGEDGEIVWLAMELLDGGSTDLWIRRHGPMPPQMAVRVASGVLTGLVAIHALGVVHRDVKPSNVLLGSDGRIKLTDFDLALGAETETTKPGVLMGTRCYMAPEQRADAANVDGRADVYAAGGTLWALLAGHDPTDIAAPEAIDTLQAPSELTAIVRRAVRANPDDRYPSADVMLADLDIAAATLPADPPGRALEEALVTPTPGPAPTPPPSRTRSTPPRAPLEPVTDTPSARARPYSVPPDVQPAPLSEPEPKRTKKPQRGPPVVALALAVTLGLCGAALAVWLMESSKPPPPPESTEPRGLPRAPPPQDAAVVPAEPAPSEDPPLVSTMGRLVILAPTETNVSIEGNDVGPAPVEVGIPSGLFKVTLTGIVPTGRIDLRLRVTEGETTEVCWSFAREAYCDANELALAKSQW